jgi:hypothetical protein
MWNESAESIFDFVMGGLDPPIHPPRVGVAK